MRSRHKMTARRFRAESRADGLFPGDIGNEERAKNYHDPNEYNNYDFQEGWDLPVSENTWEESNKRDEVGFGIPKKARRFMLAKKSMLMAECFLGEDAPRISREKQARIFASLGLDAVTASLRRWKATETVTECEDSDLPEPEELEADDEELEADDDLELDEELSADDELDLDADEDEDLEADDEEELEADDDTDFEELSADDEEEETPTETEADDEEPEMQLEIAPPQEDVGGEIFSADSGLGEAQPDAELEAMFSEGETPAEPTACKASKKKASRKQGIKHIAGQPKLASSEANAARELENIWKGLKLPTMM